MAALFIRIRRWRAGRLVGKAAVEYLVKDCEAFLSGELAVESARRGEIPQHWQWLNLLAHGSPDQVSRLAAEELPREPRTLYEAKWYAALSFLAAQMLDTVATGCLSLDEVQRSILLPLELELALDASTRRAEPAIPAVLVRKVLSRLAEAQQLRHQ